MIERENDLFLSGELNVFWPLSRRSYREIEKEFERVKACERGVEWSRGESIRGNGVFVVCCFLFSFGCVYGVVGVGVRGCGGLK